MGGEWGIRAPGHKWGLRAVGAGRGYTRPRRACRGPRRLYWNGEVLPPRRLREARCVQAVGRKGGGT